MQNFPSTEVFVQTAEIQILCVRERERERDRVQKLKLLLLAMSSMIHIFTMAK